MNNKTRIKWTRVHWKCRNALGVMCQAKRLSRNYTNALVALSFVNREVYKFLLREAVSYTAFLLLTRTLKVDTQTFRATIISLLTFLTCEHISR